jgi:hypothetical protein
VDNFTSVIRIASVAINSIFRSGSMTSQIKVQGSLASLAIAALAVVASAVAPEVSARPAPRANVPVSRAPIRTTPPPVVVLPPCKRGGPGITPC